MTPSPDSPEARDPATGDSPAVTVVIPCYNQGEFLLEAIASVEDTPGGDYALAIVNDGSTDPLTLNLLDALRDRGYWILDRPNGGLSAARNTGIAAARSPYILPLDADNRIAPNYIPRSLEILDRDPAVGVVYGHPEFFGDKTGTLELPDFSPNVLALGNFIDACAVFRKTVWEGCGGYDSGIPEQLGYEDWDFWLGAAERGWKFARIPEITFAYRFRDYSMVSRCNLPENREKLFRYICAKHPKLYAANFAALYAAKEAERLAALDDRDRWEKQAEAAELDLTEFQARYRDLAARVEPLQASCADLGDKLDAARDRAEALETALETARDRLREVETERGELAAERDRLVAEVVALRSERDARAVEAEAVREELTAARNRVEAMRTSKFWQVRLTWFRWKQRLGLPVDPSEFEG